MDVQTSSSPRFDYVKFSYRGPLDLCLQYREQFVQLMCDTTQMSEGHSGYNATSVRRYKDGNYLYIYEAWGPMCENLIFFAWDPWAAMLERLDIRYERNMTYDGVKALHTYLNDNGTKGRNVALYNSRPRTKRGGRDAGGYGLAVGSHKSDYRFSAYKRGSEPGAMEFQLRSKRIAPCVTTVNFLRTNNEKNALENPWEVLRNHAEHASMRELEKLLGMNGNQLGEVLVCGLGDTTVEAALRLIERELPKLDRAALQTTVEMVQQQLAFAA